MNKKADAAWQKLVTWVIVVVFVVLVLMFLNAQFSTGNEDGLFRAFTDRLFGDWGPTNE